MMVLVIVGGALLYLLLRWWIETGCPECGRGLDFNHHGYRGDRPHCTYCGWCTYCNKYNNGKECGDE